METQKKRGGGTVCFTNRNAWKSFTGIIKSIELCPTCKPGHFSHKCPISWSHDKWSRNWGGLSGKAKKLFDETISIQKKKLHLLRGGHMKKYQLFLPQSRRLMCSSRSCNESVLELHLAMPRKCWSSRILSIFDENRPNLGSLKKPYLQIETWKLKTVKTSKISIFRANFTAKTRLWVYPKN